MSNAARPPVKDPWEYAKEYFNSDSILDAHRMYAKYCPEVFEGFMTLRQGIFMDPPHGALSLKYKELTCVAIEAAKIVPSEGHARMAVEAGATPHEVAEVLSLCIMLGGMVTYMHSGRKAMESAIDAAQKMGLKEKRAAKRPPIRDPWEYARDYFNNESTLAAHGMYAKHCPEVFQGFMTLRQGAYMAPPVGALPLKYKELMCVAIEAAKIVPSEGHARRAIEYGATPHELAEVLCLCIMLGGMVTYMHSGRKAMEAAEAKVKELAGVKAQEGR